MMAAVTAVLVAMIAGKRIIALLQKKQIGETVRDLGLADQIQKKGTPTMGGVIIILSILSGVLLFCDLTNIYVILLLVSTLWCGAIGFTDDYIKVFRHKKEGMSEKGKLIGQIVLGFIIGLTVWTSPDIVVREKVEVKESIERTFETETTVTSGRYVQEDVVKSTKTTIPFVKNHEFDYRWLSPVKGAWGWYAKWAIYVLMIVLVITACSNGTNLTDGLDGLAAGTSAIVGVVLGIIAWLGGNLIDSNFLNIMYIPGSGEIAIFMSAFVGALIGFLWFNSFPAQVFMGDTGSLTIGGIIGVSAVLMRKELLIPLLCGVFFAESLSVIIQRFWFRYTKKRTGVGHRVWSMTPLHHHFQDKKAPDGPVLFPKPVPAQHEAKITVRFWIVGIILAVSTLALLKIR
jgi:phospho-N-acetylmuramoyl-pentapeptide-transferase